MTFSENVIDELLHSELSRTCCKKAMLYGMLINASVDTDGEIAAVFKNEYAAGLALKILKAQFAAEAVVEEISIPGKKVYLLTARAKAPYNFLKKIDDAAGDTEVDSLIGFKCDNCARCFLKGAFISGGTVSDPQKAYHLELSMVSESRARVLENFLETRIAPPKRVVRGKKIGLYYKRNSYIMDILGYLGAVKNVFSISDIWIERSFRNDINRSTNCVASNISKAVSASRKYAEAIEKLQECGDFDKLDDDLRYTARLRLENPSVSLKELAQMHEPPISKSGLNGRLNRILAAASPLGSKKSEK